MLQKILFLSLSITLLQGVDKILVDSTLSTHKASVYEQVIYTITIQIHQDIFDRIYSLDIARLYLPQAKVIEIERNEGGHKGEYVVYEMRYCLYPQESGTLTIEPLAVQVGFLDTQSEQAHDVFLSSNAPLTTSYTFSSHTHTLEVLPLSLDSQENLYAKTPLYGASRLITDTTTRDVGAGEPLEFDIALESYGDIFDLDFVLDIPNVSIYATPATISSKPSEGRYLHTLRKHFTLIAQDTYEIPSFGYSYVQDTRIYPIASTPYAIHIQDSISPIREMRDYPSWWWLGIVGIVALCVGVWLWWRHYRQSHRLYTLIARSHSYSELLNALLVRSPHIYVAFAHIIESHLYDKSPTLSKQSYDKKLLYALAKDFYTTRTHKTH